MTHEDKPLPVIRPRGAALEVQALPEAENPTQTALAEAASEAIPPRLYLLAIRLGQALAGRRS